MRLRHAYLLLCLAGTVLPYWALIPWLMEHGLDLELFARELFSTRIGAFFGVDFVSALVLFLFIFSEGRRLAVSRLWLPVLGTLLVGVSLGFPLFLYLRERQRDSFHAAVR